MVRTPTHRPQKKGTQVKTSSTLVVMYRDGESEG